MLGLPRHTVQVVPSQADWARLGETACRALRAQGGPWLVDVQHVGSTAVPGLAAKPILDIALALSHAGVVPALTRQLAPLGYCYRGDHGEDGGHLWVMAPEPQLRTAHLHGVLAGSAQWRRYLQLRDALRADAELRHDYAQLKQALARQFAHDRQRYTAGKAPWLARVLQTLATAPYDPPAGLTGPDPAPRP